MNPFERDLLSALRDLEEAIRRLKGPGPKPDLQALLERLENLTARLPATTDPNLAHYLRKKSYEKARLWLEGRDAENARGQCDRS